MWNFIIYITERIWKLKKLDGTKSAVTKIVDSHLFNNGVIYEYNLNHSLTIRVVSVTIMQELY